MTRFALEPMAARGPRSFRRDDRPAVVQARRRACGSWGMLRQGSAALLVAIFALSTGALAQTTSSNLKGTVRTEGGQPVQDAVVQARSEATGAVRTALTDGEGRYRIDLLAPGAWVVIVQVPGGGTGASRKVTLGLQQTMAVDFTVAAGITETVSVRAQAPVLDSRQVGGLLRIEDRQIETLPFSGRKVTDLALLDSGVQMAAPGGFYGERGSVFVANGQSGRSNSFLVDGLDNNDRVSGTTMNSGFSQQVIREFVVLTNQYAAEFGRASGGVLNIITRRGDNAFAAETFVQGASASWNQPGEFLSSLPPPEGDQDVTSRLAAGFSAGGPFVKDKAFYFLAYEHQEADEVTPYTGVGREGAPGGQVLSPQDGDNVFFRADVNLGDSNFLMARVSWDDRSMSDLNVGGIVTPESGFGLDEEDGQLAASLTTIVSADLFNEARVMLGRSVFEQAANSLRPGAERPSGVFGGNSLSRQLRKQEILQVVDNLTWKTGRQTLKFGMDVSRTKTRIEAGFNPTGNFIYNTDLTFEPGDCGDLNQENFSQDPDIREIQEREGVYCSGDPNGIDNDGDGTIDEKGILDSYAAVYVLVDGAPEAALDDTQVSLFAQSSWQASSSLLVDFGLRYDLSTFELPASARVNTSIENGGASPDTNNIAPRLGFSWTPGGAGKVVVRGGAGIFYDKLVLAFPGVAAITSGTQVGMYFPEGLTSELTEEVVEEIIREYGYDVFKQSIIFDPSLTLRFSTGSRLDTPYTVQYTLGAEFALTDHGVFRGGAARAMGYHQALMRDLNPPLKKDVQGVPVHRNGEVGSIAAVVTEGRSWYSGLDLSWRWQNGPLGYSLAYTLSKAEDLGPDPLRGGVYLPSGLPLAGPDDPLPPRTAEPRGERGRSDSDRRHRLVLSGQAMLPFLGGFGVSAVAQLASGVPFNVTTGGDENLDGILSDRPVGIGRNTGSGTPLGPVNALRAEGGLDPVRELDEPYFAQLDLRLWKPIPFGDRVRADFFLQVFNLLDRFNGGPIEGRATARGFGEPIGQVGPARTLELGLKVIL